MPSRLLLSGNPADHCNFPTRYYICCNYSSYDSYEHSNSPHPMPIGDLRNIFDNRLDFFWRVHTLCRWLLL